MFVKSPHDSVAKIEQIMNEVAEQLDDVIESVRKEIPAAFPLEIADSIFQGMLTFRHRML